MSSKSSNTAAAETLREAAVATSSAVPEISRQQFARSVDWMATAFRTAGALQQVNAQMSQRAALLHAQAADNARKASSSMELLQVQSSLLLYQWQEMTRYSQECMLACSRALGQSAGAGETASSANGNGTTGFTDAAMGAAGPMVHAWQQMFSGVAETAHGKH
jgi:hypothetical protein